MAAGLFLYIALTDLLPELSPDSEDHSHAGKKRKEPKDDSIGSLIKKLAIADFGMLLGYLSILVLAIYADAIEMAVANHS